MDEEYDAIVLGTGLKEGILSGLLSVDGLKVLHMDRNDYSGGESTSLNLMQFMMANGGLVCILIHTDVTKHLNFKAVDGGFVYNKGKVRVLKYGLEDDTIDFIGHALALHSDDSYLDQPALDFVKRMKLYAESLARFLGRSPYIYPPYDWENCLRYLFCCSYAHNVAPKGKYIAFVSTEAVIDNPEVELKPGIDLLGSVDEIFYDRYVPTNSHGADNCFISASYDPTTHFETMVNDVIQMYSKITGKALDLAMDLSAAIAAEE
ncbi:hypothetical protein CRYUN_Cryun04dG0072700 [Craigia yunnanensis]